MTLTVATYNVLATAYIEPARYPFTPALWLNAEVRLPALAAHLITLDADLFCLQEVEDETFTILDRALAPRGYQGALSKKGDGKPDGCAVFARQSALTWMRATRLEYDDARPAQPRSGHIAQLVVFTWHGRFLGLVNTHLKWDPASTTREHRYGYRQLTELLRIHHHLAPECEGWILCGDFNVTAEDDIILTLQRSGWHYSHAHAQHVATCNANRRARMLDYVFHNAVITSTALALPPVHNDTPLPGPGQPSDHIAVVATLQWQAAH